MVKILEIRINSRIQRNDYGISKIKMRNIEIKARIQNVDQTISKAKELSDKKVTVIKQHDIFFNVKEGRLKLRKFEDGTAELIFYKRPNILGPKLSSYDKITLNLEIVESMINILSQSCNILGVVKKTRLLYIIGQTRIHIDEVNNLGNFVELEVILKEDQTIESGQKIANDLMQALCIEEDDLLAESYMDLLNCTSQTQT